ncbi:MAG: aldo/keto reductase [Oscillospiraceae bacterium]|nr:aldo/keto reductase [Oscillospiraceae bacterium]
MLYGTIPGVDKKFSRFILGTMEFNNFDNEATYFAKLDQALELGINAIDTAQGYGRGVCEFVIGKWLKERGCREDVVITTKGCHPSFRDRVTPYDIGHDLLDSLYKLNTDYIDVYYLHRDDVKVPVSVIIDALNEHYQKGEIKSIGVANWTYDRIKEANEYAEANGLIGITIAEEHYSIAEQLADPFRRGSGTISGPKWADARKYFVDKKIPIASYSTLSGGFITGRITRDLVATNPDAIVEGTRLAYCHEVNFQRLDRTAELAKEKGVSIAQIGLAYAMSSDMDVYPIIGALNKEEMLSSIAALDLKLTKAECDWIDLTSDVRP